LTEILRRGNDNWVSRWAARNPNCPPEMLVEILRRGNNDDWVSESAANNPNCPPEMLTEILRRGNDNWVSRWAANNPNCPPEMLTEILRRGNNNRVSEYAAQNQNCPPLEKIKWMRAMGKIGKEDPSKGHIIEYEKEQVDEDLEKLRNMVSNGKDNIHYPKKKLTA